MTDQTSDNVSPEHGGAIDKPAVSGRAFSFLQSMPVSGIVFLEDSAMWYAMNGDVDWYLGLSVHERIQVKAYFYDERALPFR